MTKQVLLLLLLLLLGLMSAALLCACNSQSTKQEAKKPEKGSSRKSGSAKPAPTDDFPLLDQKNAEATLEAYGREHPESIVLISTTLGDIKIKLHDDTPLHRANFIRLVNMNFYDGTVFYRVIKDFMIQGGGSTKPTRPIGRYTIPSEMKDKYLHVRGAVAMAREYENNPEKRSASHDFFIVQGAKFSTPYLEAFAKENNIRLTARQREVYAKQPGAPHLDREHTIFGEVVSGMEVVDKIASLPVDKGHWPLEDVVIRIRIVQQ